MGMAAGGWYLVAAVIAGDWPGGASPVGLFSGVLAGAVIAFEMLLWPRKYFRRLRLGQAKYWLAAHIWLGLACLPLAIVHSGFHLGGTLPTTLMVLLTLTVLSGVYGLLVQNFLPGWMLRHVPAETIYSQIDHVAEQAAADARRLLSAACGADPMLPNDGRGGADAEPFSREANPEGQAVVVGAVREVGRSRGRSLQTQTVYSHREDAEILWTAFRDIEPFLLKGKVAGGPVAVPLQARRWFERLRRSCHDASGSVIDTLEALCEQRSQLDVQRRLHGWLHGWIPIHVALSVALTVLLIAHVWTAIKFW